MAGIEFNFLQSSTRFHRLFLMLSVKCNRKPILGFTPYFYAFGDNMPPNYKLYELMKPNEKPYRPLTPIAFTQTHDSKSRLKPFWSRLIHSISQWFAPMNEPIIEEIVKRNGKREWQIYDPISDKKVILNSPEEVLIWLEERR
ncbi:hypothetical protein [Egbenema bharatensis]|uniref:hypothetical protein n=1 Tax=Egbenema bharatensis TaxID=3463334 RepID=UPI003A8B3640